MDEEDAIANDTSISNASESAEVNGSVVLLGSSHWHGRCQTCENVVGALVGVGSIAGCHNRCKFSLRPLLCNLACNTVVLGGCSKYAFNCAAGICRVLHRCPVDYALQSHEEASPLLERAAAATMDEEWGRVVLSHNASSTTSQTEMTSDGIESMALTMGSTNLEDAQRFTRCQQCETVVGTLVGVGSLTACHARCKLNSHPLLCNLACNAVVFGGCSKYAFNCPAGICRALRRCPRRGLQLQQDDGALITKAAFGGMDEEDAIANDTSISNASESAEVNGSVVLLGSFHGHGSCQTCEKVVGALVGVGSIASCHNRCKFSLRPLLCNLACNTVVLGGCSKYAFNCPAGICRVLHRCPVDNAFQSYEGALQLLDRAAGASMDEEWDHTGDNVSHHDSVVEPLTTAIGPRRLQETAFLV